EVAAVDRGGVAQHDVLHRRPVAQLLQDSSIVVVHRATVRDRRPAVQPVPRACRAVSTPRCLAVRQIFKRGTLGVSVFAPATGSAARRLDPFETISEKFRRAAERFEGKGGPGPPRGTLLAAARRYGSRPGPTAVLPRRGVGRGVGEPPGAVPV